MDIQITRRNLFILLAILVVLIAVPLTVYFSQQRQETNTHASVSPDSQVIATVNGENITRGEVREVAREQYDDSAIDTSALTEALNTLEERKILDVEAANKSINADDAEIQAHVDSDGSTDTQAKYEVLKEKVTLLDVKNWQVYTIGFWVPPTGERTNLSADEASAVNAELKDGSAALDQAQQAFATSDDAVSIATDIAGKYKSLASDLGVNGYVLSEANQQKDLSDLNAPRVYTHDLSGVGQPFYDALYSMTQSGEVKKVLSDNDSGGYVIKLIKANTDATFNTYEEWLADQKKSLVTQVTPL